MDKKIPKWSRCCIFIPAFLGAGSLGAIPGALLGGLILCLAVVGIIRRRFPIDGKEWEKS